jgi:hypothetical protein
MADSSPYTPLNVNFHETFLTADSLYTVYLTLRSAKVSVTTLFTVVVV